MFQSNQIKDQENRPDINNTVNKINDDIPKSLPIQSPIVIAQVMDKGQEQPQQQSAKQMQNNYPQYDWDNKWLKGDEYANMLENIDEYCKQYKLQKFPKKTHPEDIYRAPQNGLIYFVEGSCVGSEFGFPRVPFRKQYRWKKMNFTTDLPKKRPQVTYIVASSVKCQKQSSNERSKQENKKESDIYRMHAVILYRNSQNKQQQLQQQAENSEVQNSSNLKNASDQQYILCHIRKMDINDEERVQSHKQSTNNNSSSSELSQDIAVNSNSQGKMNKSKNQKLSINERDDDEGESDEIEEDEIKESQVQSKRKNSSMHETKSINLDSYQNQTLLQDANKQSKESKAKSKFSDKIQNKQNENNQKISFTQTQKQGAFTYTNPEQPTDFLQVGTTTNRPSGLLQQQILLNDNLNQVSALENINKKTKFNESNLNLQESQIQKSEQSSLRGSIPNNTALQQFQSSIQNINPNIQSLSPNDQRKKSPGTGEINSITSSSNTNQNKKIDEDFMNILLSAANYPCIPSTNYGLANNFMNNQPFGYTYPSNGGMMMMQPFTHTMIPFMLMNSQYPQQFPQDQLNISQVQVHQQNQLQQQLAQQLQLTQNMQIPNNQILQNLLRLQTVNMEGFNQQVQQNETNQQIDYRNIYSNQMNNLLKPNPSYFQNQKDQNQQ